MSKKLLNLNTLGNQQMKIILKITLLEYQK